MDMVADTKSKEVHNGNEDKCYDAEIQGSLRGDPGKMTMPRTSSKSHD
jgi:hypothetical protein